MSDGGSSATVAAATPSKTVAATPSKTVAATPSKTVAATPSNAPIYMASAGYGIQALSSIGGAYAQAQAVKSAGNYQKQQYDFNSAIANLQVADALKRGDTAIAQERKLVTGAVGSERADAAAQGVDINSGSVNQGQQDSRFSGAMNEITLKNNAWREAWGYKNAATQASFAGQFAQMGAQNIAQNTLLTGGLNSISYLTQGAATYGGYNSRPGGGSPGMKTARS